MAVFPIRLFGDPVLRQRAAEVTEVDDAVRKLIRDMRDTMRDAPGVGLAANQIGVLRRVIVWSYEGDEGALVNPRIVSQEGAVEGDEACLSLPGLSYPVVRAQRVRVEGLDRKGRLTELEAEDMTARILQHEIDHVNGVLFIDHLPPELQREARRRLREAAEGFAPPPSTRGPIPA
ncbi:MAG TPA: peptide deformylase, partial [Actinomycetota bacterium]|jgi:peptide deformylase